MSFYELIAENGIYLLGAMGKTLELTFLSLVFAAIIGLFFGLSLKDLYEMHFEADIVSTETQMVITLVDGHYKMFGEKATVVQRITVNEGEKTVTFESSAEPWFGDLDN